MKRLRLPILCLLMAAFAGFLLHCGDVTRGTMRGMEGVAVNAAAEAMSSSVGGALSMASGSGAAALKLDTTECSLTGSDNDFTIDCPCDGGGTSSLHFVGEAVRGTCDLGGGDEGTTYVFSGQMDSVFDGCLRSSCGETVQIDGTVGTSLDFDYNDCDGTDLYTTIQETDGGTASCNGLAVVVNPGTSDEQAFSIGLSMTVTSSGTIDINETELVARSRKADTETSGDTFSGAVCVDGETTTFTSLEEFNSVFDAEDICAGP